jgi:hypothetical protein
MPAVITDILRLPLFPIVILALIAILYWRGALTMRQAKKQNAAPDATAPAKLGDKPKNP